MIVDDHKMLCEGLTRLIEFDEEINVVEIASDGIDCLNKIRTAKPDIILLDRNVKNTEYSKNSPEDFSVNST